MELLSGEHVAALVATGSGAALAVRAARVRPGRAGIVISRGLAVVILAAYATETAAILIRDTWTLERSLPFHLTDAVTIVAAITLWRPRQLGYELTYFWGLTASLGAVATPDLGSSFPSVFYFTYFLTHGGVVVAAVHLTWGRGFAPREGAVLRTFAITAGFAATAGLVDLLTGGNYMFLREKPESSSLLDLLGPWPWYVASTAALSVALFAALDWPFRARRRQLEGAAARAGGDR